MVQTSRYANLAIALAFCSMSYEFLLAKGISFLSGMPVVWQPVSIGVYLLGMGFGSFFFSKRKDFFVNRFAHLEFLLSVVGALSIVALYFWHIVYRIYIFDATHTVAKIDISFIYYFAVGAQFIVAGLGFLTGIELPLLIYLARKENSNTTVQILFWYQVGILAAVLFLYIVTVNRVEILHASSLVAFVNLLAAVFLVKLFKLADRKTLVLGVGLSSMLIFLNFTKGDQLIEFKLKNFYYNVHRFISIDSGDVRRTFPLPLTRWRDIDAKYPDVARTKTKMQVIDLTEEYKATDEGEVVKAGYKVLHLDQHFQFTFESEKDYHEHMAYVPINIFRKAPKKILILGAGDGLLARELLFHLPLDISIDLVEIDEGMLDFSQHNRDMKDLNRGALRDPRITLHAQDAFHFLRRPHDDKYDAVYIDFPYPFTFDTAKLFSTEFLSMVRKVLSENSYVVMDAPYDLRAGAQDELNMIIGASVFGAGYDQMIAFRGRVESFVTFSNSTQLPSFTFFSDLDINYETIPADYFLSAGKIKVIASTPLSGLQHSIFKPSHMFYPDPRF
jgi:spermidine synthase